MTPTYAVSGSIAGIDLPPGLEGSPYIFAFSLFGTMAVTALSFGAMLALQCFFRYDGARWNSPVGLARISAWLVLCSVFMRSAPDAVFLLTWGDISHADSMTIGLIDRIWDSLSVVPFVAGLSLITVGDRSIAYQLKRKPLPIHIWTRREALKRPLMSLFLILLISVGVTVAK